MDKPIVSLIVESFCMGYERQAKKEEEEAEAILDAINYLALKVLCTRYDDEIGEFPSTCTKEPAVLDFFERLRDWIEKKKESNLNVREAKT